jgi:hypothetical protein
VQVVKNRYKGIHACVAQGMKGFGKNPFQNIYYCMLYLKIERAVVCLGYPSRVRFGEDDLNNGGMNLWY